MIRLRVGFGLVVFLMMCVLYALGIFYNIRGGGFEMHNVVPALIWSIIASTVSALTFDREQ